LGINREVGFSDLSMDEQSFKVLHPQSNLVQNW